MKDAAERLTAVLSDRYRVERELGQGGMATVYLAEDLKHGRKVAIKVLHPELSAVIGGERFLSEIKTTASLQHPHILGLIDSGEADGLLYYVMPFIEGETLRARLNREKQLPIDDVVRLARETASALEFAHKRGIVHRDIKPENILLQDGQALVADFGIALAVQQAGGSRMTQTGMSLGTPAYMSPEQAMGERELGPRSDVYALGAMTYEMLTGEPPFTGPNSQAIVAKVLTEQPPPLRPKRPSVPAALEHAVIVALEKLPADRFGSAREFSDAMMRGGETIGRSDGQAVGRSDGQAVGRSNRLLVPVLAALSVISILSALAAWLRPRPPVPPARFAISVPHDQRIVPFSEPVAALSPDGELLVYAAQSSGTTQLYGRSLTDAAGAPLPGTVGGAGPVFSPSGESVAFVNTIAGKWQRVPSRGGAAVDIPVPPGPSFTIMRWDGPDRFAVTSADGSVGLLSASGTLDTIASPDIAAGEQSLELQDVLPDGNLLVIAATQWPAGRLFVLDRKTGQRTAIGDAVVNWAAIADGYLLWTRLDGTLQAAPFRGSRLAGDAQFVGAQAQATRGGRPKVAVARSGRALAFVPVQPTSLSRVARDGRSTPIQGSPRSYHNPRVSPDGRQVSMDISEVERDVWLLSLDDTTLTRATFDGDGHDAYWTPDGTRLTYASARNNQIGIFSRRVDGTGATDSVLVDGPQITLHAITPDGATGLAVRVTSVATAGFDLMEVPLTGADRKARPYLATRFGDYYPALSPDGVWLAYVSDESGRNEVYVRRFHGEGGKVLVSQSSGSEPVWSRDGRELFYRGISNGAPHLIVASVETSPTFRVTARTPLFEDTDYETATPHANYDVMPDGRSFIMVRQGRLAEFTYLQNWKLLRGREGA